jgi:WD40 repeat protein
MKGPATVSPVAGAFLCVILSLAAAGPAYPAGTAETAAAAESTGLAAHCEVNTGHAGAVQGLVFDEHRGLLFTAGEDGTVRIWDPSRGILTRKLEVTQLGARLLAVSPAAPRVAVVVTDGTGSFFLSVWDWEEERQLYRLPLKEEPLFLRFSALGTYLFYAESSWQSLKVIGAGDGIAVPFHPEGFGIVGFAEMSRSEKTLMTYQSSGSISYWDLATGQETLEVPAAAYLTHVRISPDRRLLAGSTGREILLLDAVTGATKSRVSLAGVASLDISLGGDELAAIGPDGRVSRWTLVRDAFVPLPAGPRVAPESLLLRYGSGVLYVAERKGGLGAIGATEGPAHFGDDVLAGVSGLCAARGLVALGAEKWVRVFSSDLLTGASSPGFLRTVVCANPFPSRIALAFLPAQRLLAWRTDAQAPGLAVVDLSGFAGQGAAGPSPAFQPLATGFRAPLTDLRVSGDLAAGVESGGVVRLTETATGASRFELHLPGASTVAIVSAAELVAGRNAAAAAGSLVRVNTRTGETVPLRDRNTFTYGLLLDPSGRGGQGAPVLYSVGLDASGATNLAAHDGPGFERETLLDTIAEEDLDASLSLDPDTHVLYAALGRDRVVARDGGTLRALPVRNWAPRLLVARDGMLFSLNRDSTVSVLDSATGERRAEISLFANGEWCVLFSNGRYAASPGGDVNVKVFVAGEPVGAPEDYRLPIGQ